MRTLRWTAVLGLILLALAGAYLIVQGANPGLRSAPAALPAGFAH
jgi:drug/metabolite transporter (DMT)-like permease